MDNQVTIKEWILANSMDYALRAECINAAAEATDHSRRAARRVMKRMEVAGEIQWDGSQGSQVVVKGDLAHMDLVSTVPTTVEDLIAISKLDPEVWEVSKGRSNFWGNANNPNFQIRCDFARKYSEALDAAVLFINKNLTARSTKFAAIVSKPARAKMAEIMLPDLHLGRVNTQQTASLKLIEQGYQRAIDYFIETVLNRHDIDKVVLVVGNDFFNSTNYKGETAKGTQMTEHPIWSETFTMGVQLVIESIEKIQAVTQVEIEVLNVLGNHDLESTYYLGLILEAYFRNNTSVHIDSSSENFKFLQYGKNLIGYTHKVPSSRAVSLPLLMADRLPHAWAETIHREWHVGHIHHKTTVTEHKDVNGVRIKSFPTITAASDWETNQGYSSTKREGTLLLWDKVQGCIAEFYYKKVDDEAAN